MKTSRKILVYGIRHCFSHGFELYEIFNVCTVCNGHQKTAPGLDEMIYESKLYQTVKVMSESESSGLI